MENEVGNTYERWRSNGVAGGDKGALFGGRSLVFLNQRTLE